MPRFDALRSFSRTKTWAVLRVVIGIGLGFAALDALNGQRDELIGASTELSHLRVAWLLVAIVAEVISFIEFGQLQRKLLAAGSVAMSYPYASAMSFAAGAIAASIPAGSAFASLYAYRLYRRAGADEALAGWTLVASVVCASLTLCIVATAGVFLAFGQSSSYGLVGIVIGVLLISVLAEAVVLQRRWLVRIVIACLQLSTRLFHHPRKPAADVVERLLVRLGVVKMNWVDLLSSMWSALAVWLFDCGALAASFLAVGVGVPWRGLLLTYGAAQLAVNLPITPGGLGVVEGTLTIALVAFGGSERSIVAAVLCYRVVSFWGFLPVGWLTWFGFLIRNRRLDRAAAMSEAPRVLAEIGDAQG